MMSVNSATKPQAAQSGGKGCIRKWDKLFADGKNTVPTYQPQVETRFLASADFIYLSDTLQYTSNIHSNVLTIFVRDSNQIQIDKYDLLFYYKSIQMTVPQKAMIRFFTKRRCERDEINEFSESSAH